MSGNLCATVVCFHPTWMIYELAMDGAIFICVVFPPPCAYSFSLPFCPFQVKVYDNIVLVLFLELYLLTLSLSVCTKRAHEVERHKRMKNNAGMIIVIV